MTLQQKRLVQESYSRLHPLMDLLSDLFYSRLIEIDPKLKQLFPAGIGSQGEKWIATLSAAVTRLDCIGDLEASMENLGATHVSLGVLTEHYETMLDALLWTLRMGLGEAFTDTLRDAWVALYAVLATATERGKFNPIPDRAG